MAAMTDTQSNDTPGPAPVAGSPVTGSSRRAAGGPTATDTPPGAPTAADEALGASAGESEPSPIFGSTPDGIEVEVDPDAVAGPGTLTALADLCTPGGPRCSVKLRHGSDDGPPQEVVADSLGEALARAVEGIDPGDTRKVTVLAIDAADDGTPGHDDEPDDSDLDTGD